MATRNVALAFECVLWYMCGVHIPMVVLEAARARARGALVALAVGSVIAIAHGPSILVKNKTFALTHWMQKVVVCHVWLSRVY